VVREDTNQGLGVYDGIIEKAGSIVHYEMKNWSGWYPSTIRTQFIRDLQNINNLDELRWVFNSTSGVNKGNLKIKFLETLKKADGSVVEELEDIINNQSFQSKVKKWINAKDDITGKDFLDWLYSGNNFEKLVEIIE
jgi:hypothetical protein